MLTLGKYIDKHEARDALMELFGALGGGATYYEMPDSVMFHLDDGKRDARRKRKGGS